MDLILLILSFLIMIIGIIGSVIPVLPGPLSSWVGLFMFSNITTVKVDSKILVFTLIIALFILQKNLGLVSLELLELQLVL